MALRGNLKELSLPDIFQLVTFSGKTGVLRILRNDGAQGSVWFRDGDVFFAQSNWRTEPLGERLVRAQRITPMALERALELRAEEPEGGRRLGEILVDEGYIIDKVLEAFVQEQMQDTIFDLMRWDDGDFEFEAMPDTLEEDIGLAVSIENVIMEGSRRLDEWNRIKKKIPSTDIVLKMATAPGEGTFEISLKPIEWNLLLLVDGTRSVADLALETSRTDFEVARILYGLFSAGLLEFASDDEVAASRAERQQREARLAEIEPKRQAEAGAVTATEAATAAVEAARELPEAAESKPAVEAARPPETAPPAGEAAETLPGLLPQPAEVPEFLGEHLAESHDDTAVLEAAMGAVLETQTPAAAPVLAEGTAATYTPGEEPAFITASQDAGAVTQEPGPSVEELFADLTDVTSVAQGPVSATEPERAPALTAEPEPEQAPEPEVAPEQASEPAAQREPEAAPVWSPEAPDATAAPARAPEPELAPEVAPEPEAEPVWAPEPAPAPAPALAWAPPEPAGATIEPEPVAQPELEPELAPAAVSDAQHEVVIEPEMPPVPATGRPLDLEPDLMSVAAALEAPEPRGEPAPILEPGTFVIVPGPRPVEPVEPALAQEVLEPALESSAAPVSPLAPERMTQPAPAQAPEQPVVPAASAVPAAPSGLQGFERDLMSLGLGELPAELRGAQAPASATYEPVTYEPATVEPPLEDEVELEPVNEPMGVSAPHVGLPTAPIGAGAQATADVSVAPHVGQDADFSALLESLDISADDAQAAKPLAEAPPAERGAASVDGLLGTSVPEPAGVISTDAYLDDLTLEGEFGLSGELTDELSALTGADRPVRPAATVHHLPAEGEALLHRDTRVDRDTLLKIIEGIKNL